mmetsp:Transcript_14036/g.19325  ORF Transcript_14036/g.19325 Transcript_14036/m.19325 type:complete len:276 (+) Transcript_14036:1138-1965(+)
MNCSGRNSFCRRVRERGRTEKSSTPSLWLSRQYLPRWTRDSMLDTRSDSPVSTASLHTTCPPLVTMLTMFLHPSVQGPLSRILPLSACLETEGPQCMPIRTRRPFHTGNSWGESEAKERRSNLSIRARASAVASALSDIRDCTLSSSPLGHAMDRCSSCSLAANLSMESAEWKARKKASPSVDISYPPVSSSSARTHCRCRINASYISFLFISQSRVLSWMSVIMMKDLSPTSGGEMLCTRPNFRWDKPNGRLISREPMEFGEFVDFLCNSLGSQ